MRQPLFLLVVALGFQACTLLQPSAERADDGTLDAPVVLMLDTTEIVPEPPRIRRQARAKVHDLLHTRLDLSFDWEHRYLNGKATLTLKPYFYPSDRLLLDAQGMRIHQIINTADNSPLEYSYDGRTIDIALPKKYSRFESYTLAIDYTARPDELEVEGGQAITDAKGLYFINADSTEVGKPTQVWTQGQPESNSVWFPTIDSPNERMTQEVFIRVQESFQTLSNGSLIYSNYHDDGTRTDYWKQDLDHPPYLTMIAAGDFVAARDSWERADGSQVPLSYYLEREYAPYAYKIFGNTPEMMSFYSQLLGVEYPWDKYAQIVVRDYVSGAMENTTSVIFGEFMNMDDRELLDYNYEEIIAHELFHHWFGDLVTCESWSHLPLNESFATYGEYLWVEYKYGRDAADYHGYESEQGYLYEANFKQVPLIRYDYDHPDDMFDAHSYNKGGRILHLLRETVGDSAFFASLNFYLKENAFQDVELEHLRASFERVSGKDLRYFFDQWFEKAGHPELEITYFYDEEAGEQQVQVYQLQDPEKTPIYTLDVAIDLYVNGEARREMVRIDESEHLFSFMVEQEPDWVSFDADKRLLGEKNDQKPDAWWGKQLVSGGPLRDRIEAAEWFSERKVLSDEEYPLAEAALNDPFWLIQVEAMEWIANSDSLSLRAGQRLAEIFRGEGNTEARAEALALLSLFPTHPQRPEKEELELLIDRERSYLVLAAALESLYALHPAEGLMRAEALANASTSDEVLQSISNIFISDAHPRHEAFFVQAIHRHTDFKRFRMLQNYRSYLVATGNVNLSTALDLVNSIYRPEAENWERYAVYTLLQHLLVSLDAEAGQDQATQRGRAERLRDQILANEESQRLRNIFE